MKKEINVMIIVHFTFNFILLYPVWVTGGNPINSKNVSLKINISSVECQRSACKESPSIPRGGEGEGLAELPELGGATGNSGGKPGRSDLGRPLPEELPSVGKTSCWGGKGPDLPKNNKRRSIPDGEKAQF